MSAPAIAAMRALAFGTVDGSLWAAAVDNGAPTLVAGGESGTIGRGDGLSWSDDPGGAWRLDGDGVALAAAAIEVPVAPEPAADDGAAAPVGASFVPGEGAPELVRVTGTLALGGDRSSAADLREINCLGVRVTLPAPRSTKTAPASARLVAGWLPDGAAAACVALRGRGADDHGSDAAYATVFDPERWIRVADPRLSTTYNASGSPTRANLELWIGEGDSEYPRRAAAEVAAPGGSVAGPSDAAGGVSALQVLPLRYHSRGEEGSGVYALVAF
jgi:hypothetical protein